MTRRSQCFCDPDGGAFGAVAKPALTQLSLAERCARAAPACPARARAVLPCISDATSNDLTKAPVESNDAAPRRADRRTRQLWHR